LDHERMKFEKSGEDNLRVTIIIEVNFAGYDEVV
jgi:hypothetical protein